jgi:hypothetical protein
MKRKLTVIFCADSKKKRRRVQPKNIHAICENKNSNGFLDWERSEKP